MFNKIQNKLSLNERGVGLIGVMIAAALVVVAAFTVANFITDQYRQSMKLEISGSCQNIANSVVEYIKKDETSLFINSYGARNRSAAGVDIGSSGVGSRVFPAGLDLTDDGIDAYTFGRTPPQIEIANGTGNILTGIQTLNPAWSLRNHLNIKNSSNRLVALAASGNFCCEGLNMNDEGNCGDVYYSDVVQVPGFRITDRNVDIRLGVNVPNPGGGSLCGGARQLALGSVPNSRNNAPIDFKVRVTINRGEDNQKTCEGSGRVQRNADTEAPLTLLQYEQSNCATSPTPAICGTGTAVNVRVKTVRNNAGTACQDSCLGEINSERCSDIAVGELSLFNSIATGALPNGHASCSASCQDSEPGSLFLCKIAEKGWFMANMGADQWEPCETARVKDELGNPIPNSVTINYIPRVATAGQSEVTTHAIITLSGLLADRGYVTDVKAVDTAGNVGPSFCSYSDSCNDSVPHFSIVSSPPNPSPLTDVSMNVGRVTATGLSGRASPALPTPKYAGVLNQFNSQIVNNFQCQAATPEFQSTTIPIIVGAYPIDTDMCTASYTPPGGVATPASCVCTSGTCSASPASVVSQSGNHLINMTVTNACGGVVAPATNPTMQWCMDGNVTIGVTTAGWTPAVSQQQSMPSFLPHITYPTTGTGGSKACGLVTLCPGVTGAFSPQYRNNNTGGQCATPLAWSAQVDSGCLRDPTNNLCTLVVDACGRSQNTATAAPNPEAQYSTFLAVGAATNNECFSFGGAQVSGNMCDGGAYCNINGKCTTAFTPSACSNNEDCQDASYGASYLDADGPRCVSGACVRPTNRETPVRNNCGSKYCPELNSCNAVSIGTASTTTACLQCTHWTVGAWGACSAAGQQTRSVTCPSGNCGTPSCFPTPPSVQNCPACGSAAGGTFNPPPASPPSSNLCAGTGDASVPTHSGTTWSWTCTDTPTGRSVNCGAIAPPLVNGTCGAANGGSFADSAATAAAGLCATGAPNPIPSGAGPWSWVCDGANGGTTSGTCTASVTVPAGIWCFYEQLDAGCSDTPAPNNGDACSPIGASGNFRAQGGVSCSSMPPSYNMVRIYTCEAGPSCISVNGSCGTAHGTSRMTAPSTTVQLCSGGTPTAVSGSGPWNWSCTGSSGGSTASCNATTGGSCYWDIYLTGPGMCGSIPDMSACDTFGVCNSPLAGQTRSPVSGCSNIECECKCLSVVNGACGPANGNLYVNAAAANAAGLCSAGTSPAVSGAGPWNWTCTGSGGGTNASCSTTGLPGYCSCEYYQGGGYKPVLFVGTAAECAVMEAIHGMSGAYTCIGGSTSTPQPPNCTHALVQTSSPWLTSNPSMSCEPLPPVGVDGVCGTSNGATVTSAPTSGLCTVGGASSVSGSGPWSWTCAGSGGGFDDYCSATPPAAVNGVCGGANGTTVSSAPTSGLCSVGGASSVSGSGPWSWLCLGTGGGTNAACSANAPAVVNGACGSSNGATLGSAPTSNLCSVGGATAVSGSGPWSWSCTGSGGGSTAACSANVTAVVNGVCGGANGTTVSSAPTSGLCTVGGASSVSGSGPWSWTCAGSGGGSTASCSANAPAVVNGACGSANGTSGASAPTSGLCSVGGASAVSGSGPWSWTCAGSGGGSTASCSANAPPPVNGACGSANGASLSAAPSSGLCSVGGASSVTGSGPWNWSCAGSNGGSNAACSASALMYPHTVPGCGTDFSVECNPSGSAQHADICCFPDACGGGKGYNAIRIDCNQNGDGSWGFNSIICPGGPAPSRVCN